MASSSLANQLQQLREHGAGSKQKNASFLYDSKEAARLDDELILNRAWNGLLELQRLDGELEALVNENEDIQELFSRQRVHFRRAHVASSGEEPEKLNAALNMLLDAISGYFLLDATHKVLEFLVRRYEVHRYNVDVVATCILPFHDSTYFARMVRILHIRNTRWEFLLSVKLQKKNSEDSDETQEFLPMSRSALVKQAAEDSTLLEYLYDAGVRLSSKHTKLISLYTLLTLDFLGGYTVQEQTMRWLVPKLLSALKATNMPELQSSGYMILSKLAAKATLSASVISTLAKTMVKYVPEGKEADVLLCLIFVAQTQPSFAMSKTTGKKLVRMDNVAAMLSNACMKYDASRFVHLLLNLSIENVQTGASNDDSDDYFDTTVAIVENVDVVETLTEDLVSKVVDEAHNLSFDLSNERTLALGQILAQLARRYIHHVDTVVNNLMFAQTKEKKLRKFITQALGSVPNSAHFLPSGTDAQTSLSVALDHPTEHTRFQALKTLEKQHKKAEKAGDASVLEDGDVLLRRLLDDSARVMELVLSSDLGDLLLRLNHSVNTFSALAQAADKWEGKQQAVKVLDFTVNKFRSQAQRDYDSRILMLVLSATGFGGLGEPTVSIKELCVLLEELDHPYSKAVAHATPQDRDSIVEAMASALSKDVQRLLPYSLSWTNTSEVNGKPLTPLLIQVLSKARSTVREPEQKEGLDRSFGFVLKKEFALMCQSPLDSDAKTSYMEHVAELLCTLAQSYSKTSRQEFDACVLTLLQSPTKAFLCFQTTLFRIFAGKWEPELLSSAARIVALADESDDVMLALGKTRALGIIGAALESGNDQLYREQVIGAVLAAVLALSDSQRSVRATAVSCLERLLQVVASKEADIVEVFEPLIGAVRYFIHSKEDILMDERAVVAQCGMLCEKKESDGIRFCHEVLEVVSSTSADKAATASTLLRLLADVHTPEVWKKYTDCYQQLLAAIDGNDDVADLLSTLLTHYLNEKMLSHQPHLPSAFVDALLATLSVGSTKSVQLDRLQEAALAHLTSAFYSALDDAHKHALFTRLLELLPAAEQNVASQLLQTLRALPIAFRLFDLALQEDLNVYNQQSNGKARSGFHKLSCTLEVLSIALEDDAALKHETKASASTLLRTLYQVLSRFCQPEDNALVTEYVLQVLFSCLRRACRFCIQCDVQTDAISAKKLGKAASSSFVEPEALVKSTLTCLGSTSAPQTRNEALLFVSALVDLHPSSVLSALEKILSTVEDIRKHDEYSFRVLETIIRSIVPHVGGNFMSKQQFLQVFVETLDKVPAARRQDLFSVLVSALGESVLPYLVSALLQRSVLTGNEELVSFAHQICLDFSCTRQVSTLAVLLRGSEDLSSHVDVMEEMEERQELDAQLTYEKMNYENAITSSESVARDLTKLMVAFVPSHLASTDLHQSIVDAQSDEEETDRLQTNFLLLAQLVLLDLRRVSKAHNAAQDVALWGELLNLETDILQSLQKLLSTPGFVAVVSELLHHEDGTVRKQALQLFNERLDEERQSLSEGEELLYVDLLDELEPLLSNTDKTESALTLQTALLSVDILARHFAVKHAKRFQSVLNAIVQYVDIDASNATSTQLHLQGSAYVALSSVCNAVGPIVFPLVPRFFPKLLVAIEHNVSTDQSSGMRSVLQCLLNALDVFTDKIPQFLSPYLSKTLQVLLTPKLLTDATGSLVVPVDRSLMNLITHVELRQLLPHLVGAYDLAVTQGDVSVLKLLESMSAVASSLTASSLRHHLAAFARFYVTAMDVRRAHADHLADVGAVEDAVVESLCQFILKLSEKQLKPLFLKLAEWAQVRLASGAQLCRRAVFCKLLVQLSSNLRSIFVPYYAHILEFLATCLSESREALMTSEEEDEFFEQEPPTKKAKMENTSEELQALHLLVLPQAVKALHGCFEHDRNGLMETKENVDVVLEPLVDVFDLLDTHSDEVRQLVQKDVVSALAHLAWAAKSDVLWKPLHYAVLIKSRRDSAVIRLAALQTLSKCYDVVGDEFLAMLPESLPFLAELMEDNDHEVERTCHRVIKQIEDISGESLDQYLAA